MKKFKQLIHGMYFHFYWVKESILDFITDPIKREGAIHYENGIEIKGDISNVTPKEIQPIELEPIESSKK